MKVIANRGALLESLATVNAVIPARSQKQVLTGVLLTASSDKLVAYGTDLEATCRHDNVQVQVEREGVVLVNADKLERIARAVSDDTVRLEVEGDVLVITTQDDRFRLYTMAATEFPPEPTVANPTTVTIAIDDLKAVLGRTTFCTAKESTRYAFNGVLFAAKGKHVNVCATDGKRLALSRADLIDKLGKDESYSVIVPPKALAMVEKLDGADGAAMKVHVGDGRNVIVFEAPGVRITTTLVEGQFPPYQDVIPKDATRTLTFERAALLAAVRRAGLLTGDDTKGVRFAVGKKGVVLSAATPSEGEATVNFYCTTELPPRDPTLEIGFDPKFIEDGLKVAAGDEMKMQLSEANRPGLLVGDNFSYVVMPVNLTPTNKRDKPAEANEAAEPADEPAEGGDAQEPPAEPKPPRKRGGKREAAAAAAA